MPAAIVNVDVPDLDAGRRFYEHGLGFGYVRDLFEHTVAELDMAGTPLHLIEHPSGSTAVPGTNVGRDYGTHWTPVHLDVLVEDMDAALPRALAAGATLDGGVDDFEWGRLATLRDPFGHGICLLQLTDAGYDVTGG